jgi:hypothetical protein
MAEVIYTLMASTDGTHYVEFGVDSGDTIDLSIRMYLAKTGTRLFEWMNSLGIGFITFMGSELWLHNSDNVSRCNFYGEQKDMTVGLVFNEEAGEVKVMDSIGIHSDGEWVVDSVEISATQSYPAGMYSKIPKGKFKKREGILQAEFLRNMKSIDGTIRSQQALKGEPLRGYDAYMTLRNSSTGQVSLFKVDINATTGRG